MDLCRGHQRHGMQSKYTSCFIFNLFQLNWSAIQLGPRTLLVGWRCSRSNVLFLTFVGGNTLRVATMIRGFPERVISTRTTMFSKNWWRWGPHHSSKLPHAVFSFVSHISLLPICFVASSIFIICSAFFVLIRPFVQCCYRCILPLEIRLIITANSPLLTLFLAGLDFTSCDSSHESCLTSKNKCMGSGYILLYIKKIHIHTNISRKHRKFTAMCYNRGAEIRNSTLNAY